MHQRVHHGYLFAESRVQIMQQLCGANKGVVVAFDEPLGMGKVIHLPMIAIFHLDWEQTIGIDNVGGY